MHPRVKAITLAALGAMLSGGAAMAGEPITIAKNGVGAAVIVVAKDASPAERHAAAELAEFLRQATGAALPVAHESPIKGGPRLLVGPAAAKRADPNFTTDDLGGEGLVIRTVGRDLILAGGRPRGTLYAVYTFLEDHLGCRWWSSKASTIPRKPTLTVGALNVRHVPRLAYREPYWFDAFDADWAVRNKCNGHRPRLDERRGGKHVYEGFVHTFYRLIPPGKHFDKHPEWFSEINGRRTHERAQLCLTSEPMRAELVKALKQRLRRNPAATIASVSQNDWDGHCQCSQCAALDQAEGSPSGSLLHFVNAVADEVRKEFPRVAVSTLAYRYTRKPPRHVRPRANVIVRLCSIECSFSRPLNHQRNRAFREDLLGWSKICKRLYVWDYTTNFSHYVLPHPNLRVLGPNVRFFADHNVRGVFEQGAYQGPGAEMAELRAWMLAKLLWQPSRDPARLMDEFLSGYYGPAGRHVGAYLDVIHDAVEAAGDPLGCYSAPTAAFLSLETLIEGWGHLAAAEQAVKDDPDRLHRVQVAQLPVLYTFIVRWGELRGKARAAKAKWPMPPTAQEAYARFVEIATAEGLTRLNEGRKGLGPLQQAVSRAKK